MKLTGRGILQFKPQPGFLSDLLEPDSRAGRYSADRIDGK